MNLSIYVLDWISICIENDKAALIIEDDEKLNERFREIILEANKGKAFRTFKNIADDKTWILS